MWWYLTLEPTCNIYWTCWTYDKKTSAHLNDGFWTHARQLTTMTAHRVTLYIVRLLTCIGQFGSSIYSLCLWWRVWVSLTILTCKDELLFLYTLTCGAQFARVLNLLILTRARKSASLNKPSLNKPLKKPRELWRLYSSDPLVLWFWPLWDFGVWTAWFSERVSH